MKITLMDTSILSENVGDYIIMDSIKYELNKIFDYSQYISIPTHEKIHYGSYRKIEKSHFTFIGGTNLLSSRMNKYNQWKINLKDTLFMKDIILMGVGWWQYQEKPNFYTKYLFKKVLNQNIYHSVRDSYTEKMLKSIGIINVLNTACPTMWRLTIEHCKLIPTTKAKNVIFTLTDYNKDKKMDQYLINLLVKNYEDVYFWVQGSEDYDYLKELENIDKIKIVPPKLSSYDEILKTVTSLDYVGTRLHGGVRALQNKKRALILSVDNRATEMKKDFNIPVIERNDLIKELEYLINGERETIINLPVENIKKWKSQFGK